MATARVFLVVSCLVAILLDPGSIQYSWWAFGLLAFYLAQSVIVMLLLRMRQQSTASFRLLVHSADIVWPVLFSMFTTEQPGFFLFFVFVLAAAAYRWGLWETVGTASAAVVLLWLQSLAFHLGVVHAISLFLLRNGWPVLGTNAAEFEPKRLFMRSVYLIVMALLLGYLAEQQKQLRSEKAVVARILGRVRVEAGLTGTLQDIVHELMRMYGASCAKIASQEASNYRVFVGQSGNTEEPLLWLEPSAPDRETYLFESDADTCFTSSAGRNGSGPEILGLNAAGQKASGVSALTLAPLKRQNSFESVLWVSFHLGKEWVGRIFLFDPAHLGAVEDELHFLQDLVKQIGPAVYNVYLLRRLRMRAGAVERARFSRELHDGAVQSLIGVEMQVDVLRRQSESKAPTLTSELSRVQGLLRDEVLKLRELMQEMKSLDLDSRKLVPFLADTVERFERETGIKARFRSEVSQPSMPARMCRELARIVQEGLVNVRKHSQAQQVFVSLSSRDGKWNVSIEDDGCGFPFAGRLSHVELDSSGKGPLVIKERVRLVEGELTIESNPGKGTRLEVSVPQKQEVVHD